MCSNRQYLKTYNYRITRKEYNFQSSYPPGPLIALPIGARLDIFSPEIGKGLGTHHLL